jgi:phosphonatase-like hydrolase
MSIKLAVFDLAGTTVNDPDGVGRCLRESLRKVGLEVTAAATTAVMGIPKPAAIARLIEMTPGHDHLLARVDAIHDDFVARMIAFYQSDPSVYEIDGASRVFARLNQAGIKVAVDTGFGRDIVRVLLARLGWERDGLIQASVTSDEVAKGRPHPDMIQHLMRQFGIADARQVAKIGDTPADLQEGANAGCSVNVGVTAGSHTREQLEVHPHSHLIGTIAELPAILGLFL